MSKSKGTIVVGIGGCGIKILEQVATHDFSDVKILAIDTDYEELRRFEQQNTLHIEQGNEAIKECKKEIEEHFREVEKVILLCGLGGGTATSAAPAVAQIAKHLGRETVAMLITPFRFEKESCITDAKIGEAKIKNSVDLAILFPNDILLNNTVSDEEMPQGLFARWEQRNRDISKKMLEYV